MQSGGLDRDTPRAIRLGEGYTSSNQEAWIGIHLIQSGGLDRDTPHPIRRLG